jgi:hypothetical protein
MAATKLTIVYPGVADVRTYADNIDKTMDMYLMRYDKIPLILGQFFKKDTASTTTFDLTELGVVQDLPVQSDDTDPRPRTQAAPGFNKQVTINTYRTSTELTRTLQKTDRSGEVMRQIGALPEAGRRWTEYRMSDVLNTGTSTAGSDGSNLFANDHYHSYVRGGTWSNLETAGDLTSTTFDTMRVSMANRKNEKGHVMGIILKTIKVAPLFETTARQIAMADRVPETSTNAKWPWSGVGVVVDPYQSDTDEWTGVGDLPEDNWGLHWIELTPPTVRRLKLPDATWPDIVAGFHLYIQAAAAGSIVYNMHLNQGA